jgi:hypothetical protein
VRSACPGPCPNCGSTRRVVYGAANISGEGTLTATGTAIRRLRGLEFGREVLAQALGTALGAGLVALVVKIVGGLADVPWGTVAAVAGLVVAIIAAGLELNGLIARRIAVLKGEVCPECGEPMPAPFTFHGGGSDGMAMHSNRDCPKCGTPLIWFREGELASDWQTDDAEQRRREHRRG